MLAGEGTLVCLYLRPEMPTSLNTTVCVEVPDVAAAVADLRRRGVTFEE